MRALLSLLVLAIVSAPAFSQISSQNAPQPIPDEREQLLKQEQKSGGIEQKVERIRLQDQGSTIEEVRIGGQTRSITVQPGVTNLPEYEVQPSDGTRHRPRSGSDSTTGPRVWNVMKF